MIVQPQELEVWYVIPAIRRELSKQLKLMKKPQKRIARLLGLSEAAVSQYLKNKRAKEVVFSKEIMIKIKESAERLLNKSCVVKEIQELCKEVRKTKLLCRMHKKESETCNCEVCLK